MISDANLDSLFLSEWYLGENPDVAEGFAGSALEHYRHFGWREGRSPHPLFDTRWYLDHNPQCMAEGCEPLGHYLRWGWQDLRSPHPALDPVGYLRRNLDLMQADCDPWLHYLQEGWREGRALHPLFDPSWYLALHEDVAEAGIDPLSHYLRRGWREGRDPHPLFAGRWYAERYRLGAAQNPWLHYITRGWRAGFDPHPRFHANWYHRRYLDPLVPQCEPLAHYLDQGWREGLLPAPQAEPQIGPSGRSDPDLPEAAPLYRELTDALRPRMVRAAQGARVQDRLRQSDTRGRLVLVTHNTDLGGAQTVLRLFADWVQGATRFDVVIVAVRGGAFRADFEAIAPVFVLEDHPESARAAALAAFAGPRVRAAFVNSIASGSFYRYAPPEWPSVGFIHELPELLKNYAPEMELLQHHADHVVCGGPDVYRALGAQFGFAPERLTSAHSYVEARPSGESDAERTARRLRARQALGVAPERILVMGCGVLHWRKSPESFIATAQAVLAAGLDAEFVWLGGGKDEAACLRRVQEAGLAERVRFLGYEPDVAGKLAGGDIFLLSSQEDPFPLVALYAAQAGVPIVCFRDAGGIADFVTSGSGLAVPFMETQAMAQAVLSYGRDPALRRQAGDIGRAQVARAHTVEAVGPLLLDRLRRAAGLAPEVSVIVPNYNYETYLGQRLDSIAAQSFQDFELILLDDASQDGSAALLETFAADRAATQVVINGENSGSPFVQWLRGMELAQGDILWFAEADDWCEQGFLATLLPAFDDRNMRLASAMSVPVRADGSVIGDYADLYLDRIAPGRWQQVFTASDHEEASAGLGIANTIPNASGVLMRRFLPDPAFVAAVSQMRLCGDWYFYLRALRGGFLHHEPVALNYHRRHGDTVTHRLEGSARYFDELAEVRAYVERTYTQSAGARAQVARVLQQDLDRFSSAPRSAPPGAHPAHKALPTLAVIAPDLSPGGGQMFSIALANEWQRRGGRAILINAHSQPGHHAVLARIDPQVALFDAAEPGFDLARIVERFDVDVIHSNVWWADRLVEHWRGQLPPGLPWVITMHGCHETLLGAPRTDREFAPRMARMIEQADAWVYLAEKNIAVFDHFTCPERLLRIANGMPRDPLRDGPSRADLGLREDAVVLCLAARAIAAKGWEPAVEVAERLNAEGHKVDLLLCGEGPMADLIRARAPRHVVLAGQVADVQAHFALADIGLLPSTFVGESLPLALLEMMAQGLALVASDLGEIPTILGDLGQEDGLGEAGIIVPTRAKTPISEPDNPASSAERELDFDRFLAAVRRVLDPDLRAQLAAGALARFEAYYRLESMVDRYGALYDSLGAGQWRQQQQEQPS